MELEYLLSTLLILISFLILVIGWNFYVKIKYRNVFESKLSASLRQRLNEAAVEQVEPVDNIYSETGDYYENQETQREAPENFYSSKEDYYQA